MLKSDRGPWSAPSYSVFAISLIALIAGLAFDSRLDAKPDVAGVQPDSYVVMGSRIDTFVRLAGSVGESRPAGRLADFARRSGNSAQGRFWAIVDFNKRSTEKRLFVFDTHKNSVEAYYVAHGRGSEGVADDGIAEIFSNEEGSFSSSLGVYRGLDEYVGQHGRSLRLEGLEPSNSNVLKRSIVLHTADYVSESYVRRTGRIGRSEGCFAVEISAGDTLIDQLKGGAYIIAWHG